MLPELPEKKDIEVYFQGNINDMFGSTWVNWMKTSGKYDERSYTWYPCYVPDPFLTAWNNKGSDLFYRKFPIKIQN